MELLAEKAYVAIKQAILSCTIAPGEVINEKAFAHQLGTSKTPIRHAINKLAADGLVEVFPRQGTIVRHISIRDIKNVYLVRELTEPGTSALAAARATEADILRLEQLDDRLIATGADSIDLEQHAAFHVAVAEITRVPQLITIIAGIHDQLRWFLAAQAADHGPKPRKRNHRRLLNAIREHDAEQARAITAETIAMSRDWMLQSMIKYGDD
ncbi:GntR family transcriptional regulator [Microlunatus parietis]|uniref:DNA-binding GntR family transcriptional regulator n=1 Tax=Microlunatus parietis TaxID=682979 RepID=A0A7Y9I3S4_9ACTN|nr:GntR family transcriptional regulator [Microlunatus parietis]NYE69731.1 DNA-binding GntR family transcriptional regulator [Microlunatus parietis]